MFMTRMNRQNSPQRLVEPLAPRAIVLLRLAIGFVFVTEGIQKFLYPELLGAGRFTKIGIPYPDIIGPFVGGAEILFGALVAIGLVTRFAAFALVIDMAVAIAATKVPILLGHGYWLFADPSGGTGFWAMAHEARTDLAMITGCAVLMAIGPGAISFDERE